MTGLRKIKILIPSPTSHRCKGCLELLDMLSNFVIKEGIKKVLVFIQNQQTVVSGRSKVRKYQIHSLFVARAYMVEYTESFYTYI